MMKCFSKLTYTMGAMSDRLEFGLRIAQRATEYGVDGYSAPQVMAFALELYENGIERLLDKRKKQAYPVMKRNSEESINPTVEIVKNSDNVDFILTGPILLKIKKDDIICVKLLTMLFMEADLLKQNEVAEILDCQRQTIYRNLQRFN